MVNSNDIRVTAPQDVAELLNAFLGNNKGWKKADVVAQALRQFIALKNHEQELKEKHGGAEIAAEVTFKIKNHEQPNRMASVLIY